MSLSNNIAKIIMEMLEQNGYTEIQRNELAQTLGCVPSQINYVIASRFTPEQGYIVESRRGGGGYIRISRVKLNTGTALMHTVNSVGDDIDEHACRVNIKNLAYQDLLSEQAARMILAATSDNCLRLLPVELRDRARASILKQMLLASL
jgi:transcriptional regulator CtsR